MMGVTPQTHCLRCNRRSKAALCKRCRKICTATFLTAALQHDDLSKFHVALRQVVDRRGGIPWLSEQTGISQKSLYQSLSKRGNISMRHLLAILKVLGMKLEIVPSRTGTNSPKGGR